MKKTALLIIMTGFCFTLFAENLKPVAQRVANQRTRFESVSATDLFSVSNSATQKSIQLNTVVRNATVLEFSSGKAQAVLAAHPGSLNFRIPVQSGGIMELQLFKSDFMTPDFSVVTSATNGQPVPYNGGVHYWGIIKGDPASLAAISIFGDEVMGMISSQGMGNLVLGKLENDPLSRHILYNDRDLLATQAPHCYTPEDGGGYGKELLSAGNQMQSVNCIRLYWEVNYDIYTNKGSVTAATNYVTGLFNQSAILYANDGIPVSLSQVYVWNTTSPYTGTTTSALLNQFQSNVNSFNGDLGHLLGYVGSGGIAASTNGLCNNNTDYKQCYSDINSSYQNVPTYSWSVEVVTHEQGHLMGSRHTHDCAWNGNNTKIDSCGDYAGYSSGTCNVGGGNQALPAVGGTIMSYCHLIGAVGINFSNGFGPQPTSAILTKYNNASCLTACTGPTCDAPTGMNTTGITQMSAVFSWTAASGATSYNVQYRIVGGGGWTTANTANTSYSASSLAGGTNYEWQVQTVCASGTSSFTASTNFTTSLITSCGAPVGLTTTGISATGATLNWNSIACDSFLVRYFVTSNPSLVYFKRVTPGTATSTTISGLLSSTNYTWLIRTHCNSGQSGLYSNTVSFTTSASACGLPGGLSTTNINGYSAVFHWNSVGGATSYTARYRIQGTSNWSIRSTTNTSVYISGLVGGTIYEWQVLAICQNGTSAYTNSTVFTTLVTCGVPNGLSTNSITSTSATLNWNSISCDSFLVRYFVTSAPNTVYFKRVTPGTSTSTTITDLIPGTDYSWLVRTHCGTNGQTGYYSSTVSFTTLSPSPQGNEGNFAGRDIDAGLIAYPNPARDHITVEVSGSGEVSTVVTVYDLAGRVMIRSVHATHEGINVVNLQTDKLQDGVYFLEATQGNVVRRERILISR